MKISSLLQHVGSYADGARTSSSSASAPAPSSAASATSEPSAERRAFALHAGHLVVVVPPLALVLLTVPVCGGSVTEQTLIDSVAGDETLQTVLELLEPRIIFQHFICTFNQAVNAEVVRAQTCFSTSCR